MNSTHNYETDLLLLEQDVVNTVGPAYRALIAENAANAREYAEGAAFVEKVAEDVQQDLMDTFVDTTWPACPRQPNHPLWFRDGAWRCDRDKVEIPIGQLAHSRGHA